MGSTFLADRLRAQEGPGASARSRYLINQTTGVARAFKNPSLSGVQLKERGAEARTTAGRLHALEGGDPFTRWVRSCDGHWRRILFDVPEEESFSATSYGVFYRKKKIWLPAKSVWITDLTPLRKTVFPATIKAGPSFASKGDRAAAKTIGQSSRRPGILKISMPSTNNTQLSCWP
jgi:hypothetical protein